MKTTIRTKAVAVVLGLAQGGKALGVGVTVDGGQT